MKNSESNTAATHDEKLFKEYMKMGDDFKKIEIYRLAKTWYQKALSTRVNQELAMSNLKEMEGKMKKERKVILTLVLIAIIVVSVLFLTQNYIV